MAGLSSLADKLELNAAEPAAPLRRVGLLFLFGIAASVLLQPLLALLWELVFDTSATKDLARRFGEHALRGNPGIILLVAALAPVIEEFVFRWGGFKLLRFLKIGVVPTVVLTSVAFGAAHLPIAPVNAAFATLVGLVFGTVYAKTQDIWCPVALHAGVNVGALMLMALAVASGPL